MTLDLRPRWIMIIVGDRERNRIIIVEKIYFVLEECDHRYTTRSRRVHQNGVDR